MDGKKIDSTSLGDDEYDSLHEEHFQTGKKPPDGKCDKRETMIICMKNTSIWMKRKKKGQSVSEWRIIERMFSVLQSVQMILCD